MQNLEKKINIQKSENKDHPDILYSPLTPPILTTYNIDMIEEKK